jgi:conjugative transfer pilus assembly protein TraH
MKKILVAFMFLILMQASWADVQGDMGSFFTKLDFEGNMTGTSAYQGQEAGYYSGGSAYLRAQVKDAQLVHIDLPSYSAGCGGIDLYTGGFSFIKGHELSDFFHTVMSSNTIGYVAGLALQTYVPQLKAVTDQLVDWANKINSQNISSCELSQSLVGGLMPKVMGMQKNICKDLGSQHNFIADWAEGHQKCNELDTIQKTTTAAENDSTYKKQNLLNKNLMWAILRENAFLSSDNELAEFCMSLTGTMVFDDKQVATTLPPLVEDRNVIKALLYGGEAKIYVCDETKKCLAPHKALIHVTQTQSLVTKVTQMLDQISLHIREDSPLTDQEKGFVNATALPIEKYTAVGLTLNQRFQVLNLSAYAEPIAIGLLEQYLKELIGIARVSLDSSDYMQDVQEKLQTNVAFAGRVLHEFTTHAHANLQDWQILTEQSEKIEQQITSSLSSMLGQSANQETTTS